MITLWVCIPVHNRVHLTIKCLESLASQDYSHFSVVVCDDGSTDGTTLAISERFPEVTILNGDGTLWWTGATNRCVEYVMQQSTAATDCIVTLNNDLEIPQYYLSSLANAALKYPGALITSVGYDIATRGLVTPGYRQSWLTAKARCIDPMTDHLLEDSSVASVTHAGGRGTLIPLQVFKKIGLFDEQHLPHYGADYDFSFRAAREGHPILVCFLAPVFFHVEESGMATIQKNFSFAGFRQYLTSIKSPANFRARWWLALKNCPRILLPTFLLLDLLLVVGSYIKYRLK